MQFLVVKYIYIWDNKIKFVKGFHFETVKFKIINLWKHVKKIFWIWIKNWLRLFYVLPSFSIPDPLLLDVHLHCICIYLSSLTWSSTSSLSSHSLKQLLPCYPFLTQLFHVTDLSHPLCRYFKITSFTFFIRPFSIFHSLFKVCKPSLKSLLKL